MELGDGAGLAGTLVLQVEASNQVVITPNMLADKVYLIQKKSADEFISSKVRTASRRVKPHSVSLMRYGLKGKISYVPKILRIRLYITNHARAMTFFGGRNYFRSKGS